MNKAKISAIILTLNEEHDIKECIKSLNWVDEIVVLDSGSTDATVSVAESMGARVVFNKFSGYASQRNFGLNLSFRNDWILTLDADEVIPPECATELANFVGSDKSHGVGAVRLRRRDIWWGRWLKHVQISPFFIRLSRVGCLKYEREVNEVPVVDGVILDINAHFLHYPFSKGVHHWVEKHNRYSTMEAVELSKVRNENKETIFFDAIFSKDFNNRRKLQKKIFYRLPFRVIIKFFYMMVWRFGFLDGSAGLKYILLQCIYEYLIELKSLEIKLKNK